VGEVAKPDRKGEAENVGNEPSHHVGCLRFARDFSARDARSSRNHLGAPVVSVLRVTLLRFLCGFARGPM
jgi:hypothetical protein